MAAFPWTCKGSIRILQQQKKAIRAISSESWNKHTPPRFHQLKMLPLDIDIILFMYDIYHKNLSETFLNMFTPLSSIHQHNTRKSKSHPIQFHFFKLITRELTIRKDSSIQVELKSGIKYKNNKTEKGTSLKKKLLLISSATISICSHTYHYYYNYLFSKCLQLLELILVHK